MTRLNTDVFLPAPSDPRFMVELKDLLKKYAYQVNGITEGTISTNHSAMTSYPTGTTINYGLGDKIENSAPSEQGAALSKYIVLGWVCTTAGAPGTWKEMRVLTGN